MPEGRGVLQVASTERGAFLFLSHHRLPAPRGPPPRPAASTSPRSQQGATRRTAVTPARAEGDTLCAQRDIANPAREAALAAAEHVTSTVAPGHFPPAAIPKEQSATLKDNC